MSMMQAGCCCAGGCPACGNETPTTYSVEVYIAFTWQKPICVAGPANDPPCPSECNSDLSYTSASFSFTKSWIVHRSNLSACGSEDTSPQCSYAPELGTYDKSCDFGLDTTYYKNGLIGTDHFVSTYASISAQPTCKACVDDGYSLIVDSGPPLIESGSSAGTPSNWGCCNCHQITIDVARKDPGDTVKCCNGESTVIQIFDVGSHYWFNVNCISSSSTACDCTTFWTGDTTALASHSFTYPAQECASGTDSTVCFDGITSMGRLVFVRVEDEDGNNPPIACNNHRGLYKMVVNDTCGGTEYTTGNQFSGSWVRVT